MLKKLKDILNTYTDIELEEIDFWVNSNAQVEYIQTGNYTIDLITYSDSKITLLEIENQQLKGKINKAIEILYQFTPTYESCIELLDELQEILEEND